MYTLLSAWVQDKNASTYRQILDGSLSLNHLFTDFDHVYLHLRHTHLPDDVLGLDLWALKPALSHSTQSVDDWLASLGNSSLPTEIPAKNPTVGYVRYKDARGAGCHLQRVYRHSHPESEYPLDDKRNLLIQSPDTEDNYVEFFENHLVTLGGYIHQSEHTAHGVLVPHAVEMLDKSNLDTVGLIDFSQIGGVVQRPLTGEDIKQDGNGNPLGRRFAIDFEDSVVDKTVALVIMGRLILDPNLIHPFNDNRILVDVENLDLESLYQQVQEDIDLSSLPISPIRGQSDIVLIDELRSDETIRAIMSLPTSMALVLDTPKLTETFLPVANGDVAGRAFSDQPVTEPLIGSQGLYVDYWIQNDWGKYVLNFPEQWTRRYFHDTIDRDERIATTGHHATVHPRHQPHFRRHRLEIHTLE